jgi:hypothetical protein
MEASGSVRMGYFPLSSLIDKTTGESTALTINNLLKSVRSTQKYVGQPVVLTSAIVNHDLVNTMQDNFDTSDWGFASEYVVFAILENPYMTIGTSSA